MLGIIGIQKRLVMVSLIKYGATLKRQYNVGRGLKLLYNEKLFWKQAKCVGEENYITVKSFSEEAFSLLEQQQFLTLLVVDPMEG